ncbi:DUF547 domain-containing protein [Roseobacter sp. HKCCA0434]|uniref:DUF547 domain-containing protein n=1 Tax=Roseobacter sp. HKCCA0434 TaxID=3079297 RepID=UPI00290593CD|nr:DUF547 domain-containing protein [Roseobacter sp. HKCCA0434]
MLRREFILTGLSLTLAALPVRAVTIEGSGPWADSGSGGDPDYSDYGAILSQGVRMGADGVARFDYAGADAGALERVVARLSAIDPRGLTPDAAFAYWANLYNAVTLLVVTRNWPVDSIRRIDGSLFSPGPWSEKRVRMAGTDLSLDDIEHEIMRPVFADPRVHYAVNCASIGCPNLRAEPWRAAGLEAALDAAARAYVNHPRGAAVGRDGLVVSSIYHWFDEDFGGTDAGVIAHLGRYADDPVIGAASRIADHRYDWSVNAV